MYVYRAIPTDSSQLRKNPLIIPEFVLYIQRRHDQSTINARKNVRRTQCLVPWKLRTNSQLMGKAAMANSLQIYTWSDNLIIKI